MSGFHCCGKNGAQNFWANGDRVNPKENGNCNGIYPAQLNILLVEMMPQQVLRVDRECIEVASRLFKLQNAKKRWSSGVHGPH